MLNLIILFVLNILSIGFTQAQTSGNQAQNPAPTQPALDIGIYNDCEGADAANYTLLLESIMSSDCSRLVGDNGVQLIQSSSNNQASVMPLQLLATSQYPSGALSQVEALYLATSGPLAARYIYHKVIYLATAYLKKCSSVLGYSFVSSRSAVLLISQNLDLNIFLAPNGAFETFKRSSTTICRGRENLL